MKFNLLATQWEISTQGNGTKWATLSAHGDPIATTKHRHHPLFIPRLCGMELDSRDVVFQSRDLVQASDIELYLLNQPRVCLWFKNA